MLHMLVGMQAVTEQQVQREAMFSADAKAARRKSAASAMLPRVFDTLRAVFGSSGPAVRLHDEVRPPSYCFCLVPHLTGLWRLGVSF